MKIGIRKPSLKKSFSARTTGKAKRKLKRLVVPFYGKKGIGFVKNPIKSVKGKIYRKTTVSAKSATKGLVALFMLPFYMAYYGYVFLWYTVKYLATAIIWIFVQIVNLLISLVEWIINLASLKNKHQSTNSESNQFQR